MGQNERHTKCGECETGPRGIVGHEGLAIRTEEKHADAVLFKCAMCSTAWLRTYDGGGNFAWSPFTGRKKG